MGLTIVEKIFSAHSGAPAKAGDLVVAEIDYVMAGDAKGPKAVDIFRESGLPFRLDPKKTDFIIDHFVPAFDVRWADDHVKLREFAGEQGLQAPFIDRVANETQSWVTYSGGHAPHLPVLAFMDGELDPAGRNVSAITDRGAAFPEPWWFFYKSGARGAC